MPGILNRDSVVWWLALAGAVVGYLLAEQDPPTLWGYTKWLQFAAFSIAWFAGKMATSPLPGAEKEEL
jgi:hypothetical protein